MTATRRVVIGCRIALTNSVTVIRMAILSNADVASKVRGVAAEKRTTQADLAGKLGMSPMAISRRMSGATPFTPEELIVIAKHFDVSVGVFFGEASR